jgi:tyrosine-protein kinase
MTDNELLRMLWRGRYLIVASLVLSVGAAVLVTSRLPRVYRASGIVQVQQTDTQATVGDLQALQQVSQSLAASYATLLDSNAFLQRLREHAPGRLTLHQLQNDVSASALTVNNSTTNLIKVSATASSPAAAERLARTVSNAFVTLIQADAAARATTQRKQLTDQIDALSEQIATLRTEPGAAAAEQVLSLTASRTALAGQLASVVANEISAGQNVNVVAPPTAESAPVSPHPTLDLAIGGLLGLLVGVGLAWVRERVDTGLESPKRAEELLGVPNLATIPRASGRADETDEYFAREAYELLRANLGFLAVEHDLKVVTITSYNPGEGKSSVAEGLATAAVRSGLRVLLVDGDLRTSELSHRLSPESVGRSGLTSLVLSASTRGQEPGAVPSAPDVAGYLVPLQRGLSLLPAGVTPPNPASFLSGPAVGRIFETLRGHCDLVIVDSPPVGHLADAALLAAHSDGVILVTRVGLAKRGDLVAAAASLRHLPTPLVGCVVFDAHAATGEQYYGVRRPRSGRPRRFGRRGKGDVVVAEPTSGTAYDDRQRREAAAFAPGATGTNGSATPERNPAAS